jgi:hypothetical protein
VVYQLKSVTWLNYIFLFDSSQFIHVVDMKHISGNTTNRSQPNFKSLPSLTNLSTESPVGKHREREFLKSSIKQTALPTTGFNLDTVWLQEIILKETQIPEGSVPSPTSSSPSSHPSPLKAVSTAGGYFMRSLRGFYPPILVFFPSHYLRLLSLPHTVYDTGLP